MGGAPVVVTSFKGTSLPFFDGGNGTGSNDWLMDNLMFSCCCAHVSPQWTPVCDCFIGDIYGPLRQNDTCSQTCLRDTLSSNATLNYLRMAMDLDALIRHMYPNAAAHWKTGHSLGGSVAALLALASNTSAVAFEAPGERLYAERLGLWNPNVPTDAGIYHFGVASDPIFTGTCNGVLSACATAGYAMESRCHTGHECVYPSSALPTVNEHRMTEVLKNHVLPTQPPPACKRLDPRQCTDCGEWRFL